MKQETLQEIREVLKRVVFCAIPVRWTSNQPGRGDRRSFYRGSGHDFDSLTEYVAGDDPRDIDWKATAQTGGEVILKKVYREQRDLKVFVLADVNPSMNFGTKRVTKRRLAAELAASVCKAAEETNDRFGFVAYSETGLETYIPSRAPKRALLPTIGSILETSGQGSPQGSGLVKALKSLPASRSRFSLCPISCISLLWSAPLCSRQGSSTTWCA
jgi:uncharacterized protein (DUF58 family)